MENSLPSRNAIYPNTQTTTRPVRQLMDLSGRNALVVGGAGHIGSVVVDTLIELGCDVTILDVNQVNLTEPDLYDKNKNHKLVNFITCDLRDEEGLRHTMKAYTSSFNKLDIVVHCAAYIGTSDAPGWAVPFEQQTVEAFNDALRINLTSAFVIAQETKTLLDNSGHGAVILFSSIYGIVGSDSNLYQGTEMHNPIGYGASKGGVLQLTRQLATVMAPNVRVNAISPGGVWRDQPNKFEENYSLRTPLSRMATEEDLKGAVAYLASDLSSYVTGLNLVVDGGWTIW